MSQPAPVLPPETPPDLLRAVRGELATLGLQVRHLPGQFLQFTTVAPAGSPYHPHQVSFGTLEDARQIVAEFPAHAAAPPPWTAALAQQAEAPTPHIVAWTGGYMAAARQFFPKEGPFVPLRACNPAQVPSPYEDTEDASAFYSGVRSYLRAVRKKLPRPAPAPEALTPTAKEA